jgi:hypothetical protein
MPRELAATSVHICRSSASSAIAGDARRGSAAHGRRRGRVPPGCRRPGTAVARRSAASPAVSRPLHHTTPAPRSAQSRPGTPRAGFSYGPSPRPEEAIDVTGQALEHGRVVAGLGDHEEPFDVREDRSARPRRRRARLSGTRTRKELPHASSRCPAAQRADRRPARRHRDRGRLAQARGPTAAPPRLRRDLLRPRRRAHLPTAQRAVHPPSGRARVRAAPPTPTPTSAANPPARCSSARPPGSSATSIASPPDSPAPAHRRRPRVRSPR